MTSTELPDLSRLVGNVPIEAEAATPGDPTTPRLLKAREVAEMLGVSTSTVLDWFESGRLPGFKLNGRAVRFAGSELAAWLETQRVGPTPFEAASPAAGSFRPPPRHVKKDVR